VQCRSCSCCLVSDLQFPRVEWGPAAVQCAPVRFTRPPNGEIGGQQIFFRGGKREVEFPVEQKTVVVKKKRKETLTHTTHIVASSRGRKKGRGSVTRQVCSKAVQTRGPFSAGTEDSARKSASHQHGQYFFLVPDGASGIHSPPTNPG
jgi:hypothetical protein